MVHSKIRYDYLKSVSKIGVSWLWTLLFPLAVIILWAISAHSFIWNYARKTGSFLVYWLWKDVELQCITYNNLLDSATQSNPQLLWPYWSTFGVAALKSLRNKETHPVRMSIILCTCRQKTKSLSSSSCCTWMIRVRLSWSTSKHLWD